jgi:hypothetical protein
MLTRAVWAVLMGVLLVASISGCGSGAKDGGGDGGGDGGDDGGGGGRRETAGSAAAADNETTDPREYFPLEPGMRWVYKVEQGTQPQQAYWSIIWPGADGTRQRQWFDESGGGAAGKLTLRVKGKAASVPESPGAPYDYALEIEVEEDAPYRYVLLSIAGAGNPDFNPFNRPQVLWGVKDSPFGVDEVLLFKPEYAPPEAKPGSTGRQTRSLFFRPGPFTVQHLESDVWLSSVEHDRNVPGYEGQVCYHFVRKFRSEDDPTFTEDLWYAKGKGLVRLVQKSAGQTSLTMTLSEFTR